MGTVSNRFFVTAIKDGSTVNAVMRIDDSLSQMYNPESGSCDPNWNAADNHPKVWVETDINGVKQAPDQGKWYYNAIEIVFGSNNKSTSHTQTEGGTTYPVFEKTTHTVSGESFPALIVLRNLATEGNTDQDVISYDGSLEISGSQLGFSVSTAVRLSKMTSSGYQGVLKGDQAIRQGETSATVTAKLFNAGEPVSSFYTKWYDEGTNQLVGNAASSNGVATFTIQASAITDYIVLRCEFYETSSSVNKLYTMYWEIDDETDPERMYIANGASNNKN